MKTSRLKNIGRIVEKTFKILFYTGSLLIFIWIAGCLGSIAADYFNGTSDDGKTDQKISLIKC